MRENAYTNQSAQVIAMKTFQNIIIDVPNELTENFIRHLLIEISNSEWKLRDDLKTSYQKNTFVGDKKVLCIESCKFNFNDSDIKGYLWMWNQRGYFEIFNISPVGRKSLEMDEYNYIIKKFYTQIANPVAEAMRLRISLTEPVKFLMDSIGLEAFDALKKFSDHANKATGHSNPYDFERWCDFIFTIFKRKIDVDNNELSDWLIENGWPSNTAYELRRDFDYSISLLEKYERD